MSLLVHYTLKSADDHAHQVQAMEALIADLTSEGVTADYSAFSTGDATRFVAVLEFQDDAGKQSFLQSRAFATYKETVGPTFANPPETTDITAIASTKG